MALRVFHRRFKDPYDDDCVKAETDRLWVVTAVSNPARYRTRYDLYHKFRDHVVRDLRLNLVTVECALGDRGFCVVPGDGVAADCVDGVRTIDLGVRNRSWVWLKENLMNLGAAHVPKDARYLFFSDADVTYVNTRVGAEIVHALQTYKVVQPWETCCDLGSAGDVFQVHRSFGWCAANGWDFRPVPTKSKHACYGYTIPKKDPAAFGTPWHPGFALAMKKSTFDQLGGLYDHAALGAGDHHMCCSFIGKAELSRPGGISPQYAQSLARYQDRVSSVVKSSFSYVPGTILHGFHGTKESRAYVSRWDILVRHAFDPYVHLVRNNQGVHELADGHDALRDDIIKYFMSRNEDVL